MQHTKKVALHTLGCKLNFSETSTIARDFEKAGYARVELDHSPDILVINTCSVTDNADKRCRQLVRKALRNNPDTFVTIIGCYAQLKPEEIASIEGVDLVLGSNEKFNILAHIESLDKATENATVKANEIKETREFVPSYSFGDRTRSFLKVQDGCDYFCSFCTIPLARGRSRSASIAETIESAKEVAKTNVNEIVLTGVNIGDFGKGSDETFFHLVKELDKIEGIERFRISSIEPNLLTNEIIEFVAQSKKFVPHFHIPLQSGNNELLKLMRRRYDRELYANRIAAIKKLMPDCCIGVDVIIGFPSETEERFLDTLNFLKELPISYLHVFTYSERPNTTAVRMDEVVKHKDRNIRSKSLHSLSEKKKRAFYESQIGTEHTVLFETDNNDGFLYGFTENYVKVKYPYRESMCNSIHQVALRDFATDGLVNVGLVE